jgi:hypothetical protein
MNEKQAIFDWKLAGQWVLACAVGILVFGFLAFGSIWTAGAAAEEAWGETAGFLVAGTLFGGFMGLGASVGTSLVLRGRGVSAGAWILYSLLAGAIGAGLAFTVVLALFDPELLPEPVAGLMMGLVLGASVGLGQWLAWRRAGISAGAWPAITVAAFVIGLMIGLPLGGEGRELLSLGVTSAVIALVSGVGLVWMLRGREAQPVAVA